LTGEWAQRPIAIYGRNEISGTHEFFGEIALYDGDYRPEVKQQPGSEAVVVNVAKDRFAIGYSVIGSRTEGVRAVRLAISAGRECSEPSAEAAYSGKYPIARFLYIFFNRKPTEELDPLRGEFLRYILSREGQAQTGKGGYYPITSEVRQNELKRLELSALAK
jgi:phosphate transport system substrate-binding protein